MPKQLETTLTFTVGRVRRNNGVIEILFSRRPVNGSNAQEEHGLFNLLLFRGEPVEGEQYEITIKPLLK